ncbi:MAG: hypothetical protein RL641_381 [Candidatus Parcubacteria bacterium]|jgi:geranylgeranyl diphosphate synthase type I
MKELVEFKKYFDAHFISYLRKCIDRVLIHHPDFGPVGEHLVTLARGGKRLRPFVLDLAYRSSGGNNPLAILPALFALELFQLFALIHDDIIDNGSLRHGVETMHIRFDSKQAILVGDHCLAWATRAIALAEQTTQKEMTIFMRLVDETITGQLIDVSLIKKQNIDECLLDTSIELKTARYTFIYPALLGLSYAGEDFEIEKYKLLGHHLGHAFQRQDDLSDIVSHQADLGKKLGSDISENKPTHLAHYFETHATASQKSIFSVYRGSPLDDNDIIRVRELLELSGAIENERKAIEVRLKKAMEILENISMAETCKKTWLSLVAYMQNKNQ